MLRVVGCCFGCNRRTAGCAVVFAVDSKQCSNRGVGCYRCSQSTHPSHPYAADVDGTLVRSVGEKANAVHKEAFSIAMQRVFGVTAHIDEIEHHGSTDPLILIKVLELHGIGKEEVWEDGGRKPLDLQK